MIIYHGSTITVDKPEILPSQRMLDFGQGFYTTTNEEQAKRWARRVASRRKCDKHIVSVYEFDENKALAELEVKRFERADESWLEFVCICRSGKKASEDYDIVIGPVADDNVYATVQLFELGILSKEEAVKRLKVEELYNQILFHTEKALKLCRFKNSYEIGGEDDGEK